MTAYRAARKTAKNAHKSMTITMAQFKWAWRELYGKPFNEKTDGNMHAEAGVKMFTEHGEAGITAAIAGYSLEAYLDRKDV